METWRRIVTAPGRLRTLGLALAAAWTTAVWVQAAPQTGTPAGAIPAGNADDGRKAFVSYGCYQCHGYEAQGSSATGPRLGPRPIAWASVSRYVRRPTGQMPPYTTAVLSDQELANIYAFLQSRPAPPAGPLTLLK